MLGEERTSEASSIAGGEEKGSQPQPAHPPLGASGRLPPGGLARLSLCVIHARSGPARRLCEARGGGGASGPRLLLSQRRGVRAAL